MGETRGGRGTRRGWSAVSQVPSDREYLRPVTQQQPRKQRVKEVNQIIEIKLKLKFPHPLVDPQVYASEVPYIWFVR